MLEWMQAIGGLAASFAAVAVAVFAIRRQEASSVRALDAQAEATRVARVHQREVASADRLWARRADLYGRVSLAMREHLDRPKDESGNELPLSEVPLMANLSSEAEILASSRTRDLIAEFVYGDPDRDEKINIWSEFQWSARRELAGGRADPVTSDHP
ncbi:hypothetical protein [Micromonospora noduli]|uniref:hypothetical protein n=1 Tax=Micromonospora noduli TaxID=709876 RepID=UPI0011BF1EE8|nr:hypothetical protein [Micromonospora noduli]